MEKLMVCEERLKEFERQNSGKIAKLQRRLLMEMGVCFSELQSLVEVCIQRSEGQDPNISALISVKGTKMLLSFMSHFIHIVPKSLCVRPKKINYYYVSQAPPASLSTPPHQKFLLHFQYLH